MVRMGKDATNIESYSVVGVNVGVAEILCSTS